MELPRASVRAYTHRPPRNGRSGKKSRIPPVRPAGRLRSRARALRVSSSEGMARVEDVIPKAEGETLSPMKTFKDYEPGFVHIDIKYLLPQTPDERARRYLFMAIDRAT